MLKIMSKGTIAVAATATLLSAGSLQAEIVNVLIGQEAYFPDIIYVNQGDTLVFTNESGAEHVVMGQDGEWTTGPIGHLASVSVDVDKDMHVSFTGTDVYNVEISGNLNYSAPPLEEGQ